MTSPMLVRWAGRLELLILSVGLGLRLARFLAPRPLWLDEAMLALNVITRSPIGFRYPLDANQISPLGFLWTEWAVTRIAGNGEKALRVLAVVAAVAALIAFARLTRRLLEPGLALLATALAALSPLLIYYSAEVKSYGFDWLCAIIVMHATLSLLERMSREAWWRWALAAAFSAMLSTAAPFFIAGSAMALLLTPAVRRDAGVFRIAMAVAPAALIFVGHLLTVYRSPSTTSFMQVYWTETFLTPRMPDALVQAAELARNYVSIVLFNDEVSRALPRGIMAAILACSALGAFSLGRQSLPRIVMLLAPVAFATAASLAHWWPLTPRLLLFAVPALLITLPAGLGTLSEAFPGTLRRPLQLGISVALLLVAAVALPGAMRAEPRFKDIQQALREVATRHGPSATIYVSSDLGPTCAYYLGWHADRFALGADSTSRSCTLRGTRTLVGKWPEFVGIQPGLATRARKIIVPEWLETEGQRILEQPGNELWVLVGNLPELRSALPSWLETAGANLTSERSVRGINILEYRRN